MVNLTQQNWHTGGGVLALLTRAYLQNKANKAHSFAQLQASVKQMILLAKGIMSPHLNKQQKKPLTFKNDVTVLLNTINAAAHIQEIAHVRNNVQH